MRFSIKIKSPNQGISRIYRRIGLGMNPITDICNCCHCPLCSDCIDFGVPDPPLSHLLSPVCENETIEWRFNDSNYTDNNNGTWLLTFDGVQYVINSTDIVVGPTIHRSVTYLWNLRVLSNGGPASSGAADPNHLWCPSVPAFHLAARVTSFDDPICCHQSFSMNQPYSDTPIKHSFGSALTNQAGKRPPRRIKMTLNKDNYGTEQETKTHRPDGKNGQTG